MSIVHCGRRITEWCLILWWAQDQVYQRPNLRFSCCFWDWVIYWDKLTVFTGIGAESIQSNLLQFWPIVQVLEYKLCFLELLHSLIVHYYFVKTAALWIDKKEFNLIYISLTVVKINNESYTAINKNNV